MNILIDYWPLFRDGFLTTIELFLLAGVASLVFGTILAMLRVSPVPVFRATGTLYVTFVRNTPLTLVFLFFVFAYPYLDIIEMSFFTAAVVALTVYTSAFICEVVRSGINTVPLGQAEAARALGLSFTQVLNLIILPQAFRSVVAPLANVLIALTKNTTVAATIGVAEAALVMKEMIENEAQLLLISAIFAFGFICLTLPTGLVLGWVSKKVAVKR